MQGTDRGACVLCVAVIALLLSVGCGDDEPGSPVDAGASADARDGVDSGPTEDGGIGDATVETDAALGDGGADAGAGGCTVAPATVLVTMPVEDPEAPSIAWTGTELALVRSRAQDDTAATSSVPFSRHSLDGAAIGAATEVRADTTGRSFYATLLWNGTQHLVGWADDAAGRFDVRVRRVSAAGTTVGDPVTLGGGFTVSMVWTGSEYWVVWLPRGLDRIVASRMSASGALVGSLVVLVPSAAVTVRDPKAVYTGSELAVAWIEIEGATHRARFARFDSAGGSIGSPITLSEELAPLPDGTFERWLDMVWTGSEHAVAFTEVPAAADPQLRLARIATSGSVAGTTTISIGDGTERHPSLAWTGSAYGLAWRRRATDTDWDVRFALVDASGGVVERLVVDSPASIGAPSLAWTGSEFALATLGLTDPGAPLSAATRLSRITCP